MRFTVLNCAGYFISMVLKSDFVYIKEAQFTFTSDYRPEQSQWQRWQPLGLNTHYCSSLEESSYSILTCGDREGIDTKSCYAIYILKQDYVVSFIYR